MSNKEHGISNGEVRCLRHSLFGIPCSVFSSWSSPAEKPYGQAAAFAVESTPRATRGGSVKMVVAQATTLHELALRAAGQETRTCLAWPRRVARGFIPRVFVNAGHKAPRYAA